MCIMSKEVAAEVLITSRDVSTTRDEEVEEEMVSRYSFPGLPRELDWEP